jgi:ATP-dependent DNA helicase RecG
VSPRSITLEQLSLLPEDYLADSLRLRREDQWFDRKSNRVQPRQLADVMAAFANAEGGVIAIGFRGDRVEGVDDSRNRIAPWRQAALDLTEPSVRHRFEEVPCVNHRGRADHIVLIEVEASERVHLNTRGDTYLRVGDETRRLGPFEAQELRYDKGESVFDGTPAQGISMDDLDPDLTARYGKAVGSRFDVRAILEARGLAARRKGLVPTVAGALVLGRHPQVAFSEASVRLLRYQGSSRETGSRSNVARDRRLDGPLPLQITAARRLLRRWMPRAIRLAGSGTFEEMTIIPDFAWLEALVNGVVHRSYSMGGDHVRVEVFDDRLEVESPGRLPGLVRPENIRRTRFARNPRIARAMNDLGYGRELGEGVDRMFEEMQRAGLSDPIYSEGPASVRVTLLADPLAKRILEFLPTGSERFAEYLTRTGRVSTSLAVQLFGASRPTALKYLHLLREAGLIEHVGTSLKDPRGFWRLLRRGERIGKANRRPCSDAM